MSDVHAIVSSMSNLVPTPRVNKNGIVVIRHMQLDAPARTHGGLQLPAPQAPSDKTLFHRERLKFLGSKIAETYFRNGFTMLKVAEPSVLITRLGKLDSNVVRGYYHLAKVDPQKHKERLLIGVLNNELDSHEAGYVLLINKALPDRDDGSWDTIRGGNEEYVGARNIHHGILRYWKDAPADILQATEAEQERVRALAMVTRAVMESDSRGVASTTGVTPSATFLTDNRLIALTIDNADKAGVIEFVIRERRTCNYELIKEYLQSESPALREGML